MTPTTIKSDHQPPTTPQHNTQPNRYHLPNQDLDRLSNAKKKTNWQKRKIMLLNRQKISFDKNNTLNKIVKDGYTNWKPTLPNLKYQPEIGKPAVLHSKKLLALEYKPDNNKRKRIEDNKLPISKKPKHDLEYKPTLSNNPPTNYKRKRLEDNDLPTAKKPKHLIGTKNSFLTNKNKKTFRENNYESW